VADRVLSERYRIVRHLARGGMAEVYLARDQLLDRPVAVKLLFPELAQDPNFVERFRREARAAAGLNHHNIVSVYDFGEDEGSYFIVMEYVEGTTLRDIIRAEGPQELSRIVEIGSEVAAALAIAHANGIVHRDVKPGNVLISSAGPTRAGGEGDTSAARPSVVKVADFGIARAGDPREGLTQTGAVMGTATYLSPEQAQGGDVDVRTDVYSLGVVLYEMATGRPPFTASSPVAIAYQHVNETPQAPSSLNPALPPAFDAVVLEALAKDPADRQGSATEIRAQLLALAAPPPDPEATVIAAPATVAGASSTQILPPVTGPTGGIPPPVGPPLSPTPDSVYRRRRLVLFGVLGLLLVAMVVIIALLSSGGGGGTASVPRVVDLTVDEAKAAVSKAGLTSRVEQQPDRTGDPNRVVDQNPAAGSKVKQSSVVTLVVPGTTTTTVPTTRPVTTPEPTTARPATSVARPTTVAPTTEAPTTVTPTSTPRTTIATTPTT